MAQIKLNTIQIVLMANYKNLLIQIIHMAHICENDMIQIKDMFKIEAAWLQFSTEEYVPFGRTSSSSSYFLPFVKTVPHFVVNLDVKIMFVSPTTI